MKRTLGIFSVVWLAALAVVSAQNTTINFDQDRAGAAPRDFTTALTGQGKPGDWIITKDEAAPQQKQVLAQTDGRAIASRSAFTTN